MDGPVGSGVHSDTSVEEIGAFGVLGGDWRVQGPRLLVKNRVRVCCLDNPWIIIFVRLLTKLTLFFFTKLLKNIYVTKKSNRVPIRF